MLPCFPLACGRSDNPAHLWITFWDILLFLKGWHISNWVALLSHLVESQNSDSLPSFCPISVFLSPSWQCFYWYNSISIPAFFWKGWLAEWVMPIISLLSDCLATPLVLGIVSRTCTCTLSLPSMCIDWEFSKSSGSSWFFLNNIPFNLSLYYYI